MSKDEPYTTALHDAWPGWLHQDGFWEHTNLGWFLGLETDRKPLITKPINIIYFSIILLRSCMCKLAVALKQNVKQYLGTSDTT